MHTSPRLILFVFTTFMLLPGADQLCAQQAGESGRRAVGAPSEPARAQAGEALQAATPLHELTERERYLLERIEQLERRLAELEARAGEKAPAASSEAGGDSSEVAAPDIAAAPVEFGVGTAGFVLNRAVHASRSAEGPSALDFLRETTLNLTLDGYYGYNFNRPVGRINLLRAYDVLSNSFSLNQAAVVIERAPNVAAGRRFGVRLDLQYGQATETLQGSGVNEPRPQVYRPVFQAYGTYVAPVGSGLTVDFGKWASPLGFENNYTKDQINYSRSYFYNFLPFYHFGFRASYSAGPIAVSYWVVNGANQSEDFNGFKSQAVVLTWKPAARFSWNLNYYTGREGRDVAPALNPGLPLLPTQPGLSAQPIVPAPRGRFHILDTYASWNATSRLTLAGEFDYVVNRTQPSLAPAHVTGGVAYARYRFSPKFALAARAEYLSDRGGLFSGITQALKETTLTADYNVAEGFLVRTEWRRDFSNRPFFLTAMPGRLKREQNTATLGLIWWFGGKQGAW